METEMQVGDVREFHGKMSIVAALGVFAGKRGAWLYIDLTGDGENLKHIAVTNNPDSPMYHRTLFRDLRRLLMAHGKWQHGEEGAETENQ